MRLSNIAKKFSGVFLEGWDFVNQVWVPKVAVGNEPVFDRFISDRTFGQAKRLFMTHPQNAIPDSYQVVRDPAGRVFMVESVNPDMNATGVYSLVYQFREAPFTVRAVAKVKTMTASGVANGTVDMLSPMTFCSVDRYAFDTQPELGGVQLAQDQIYLPQHLVVDQNNELEIGDDRWAIEAITQSLKLQYVRALAK